MREDILAIDTPTHTLAATLTYALTDQTKALVVMFPGSGPIDRNENLPSFSLNIFNALAESFANSGYASLRYDKRGCGASGGDYISAGHKDFVNDAAQVTQHARQLPDFINTPLILLGHSEGAAIAPQVAQMTQAAQETATQETATQAAQETATQAAQATATQAAQATQTARAAEATQPKVASIKGLILLCPFARPMREVLTQQAKNRTAEIQGMTGFRGFVTRSFVRLRGGFDGMQSQFLKRVENSSTDTITHVKVTLNAKWYREMLALDIQDVLKNIETPTLAIGGGKDTQCDPKDTAALNQLITKAAVSTHIEQNLTHILRCDDQPPGTARYPHLAKEPIDESVAKRCCEWMDDLIKVNG